jgi:glycosyltransferase involved in cell wall biosynthesis
MHIGFEAKRFFSNFTGLGNYSRFIVDSLSEFAPDNSYTLFTPAIKSHPDLDAIVSRSNVNSIGPSGIYQIAPAIWRSYGISRSPAVNALDIFHGLSHELPFGLPGRVRKVVTVHDLIFLRFPQYYNPVDVFIYKTKVRSGCAIADKVIAISEQTANDLVEFLQVDKRKIRVVYQGCHPAFREKVSKETMQAVKEKYQLPDHYILNVGTIEERKNLRVLVEALPLLPGSIRPKVLVVGRKTKYMETVLHVAKQLNVSDQIVFLNRVEFKDLPAIYRLADLFVYPSVFEGFGIPLVEAIECDVPVITSTGSCFKEAAGPHSLYADPNSKEEFAQHIGNVLSDSKLREQMIVGSREHARKFKPSVIAEHLIKEYSDLL